MRLDHIASRAEAESFCRHVLRAVFGHEQDLGRRGNCADAAGGFESVQSRQTNVQQDQVWAQCCRFLDSRHPVRHLGDDLELRQLF